MNYKIIILLCFLFIIITYGCSTDEIISECEYLNGLYGYDRCIKEIAVETKNINFCNNFFDDLDQSNIKLNGCYEAVAITKNDPKLCNKIKDDEFSVRTCLSNIAKNKKDYEICLKIDSFDREKSYMNSKYGCLADVGELKQDIALCVLSKNSNCFINVAKKKNTTRYCNLSNDVSQMNLCRKFLKPDYGNLYPEVAWDELNPELCGNDTNGRSLCIREISDKLNDTNICNYEKNSYRRGRCYYLIIDKWKDWNQCSNINSNTYEQKCYEKFLPVKRENEPLNYQGIQSLLNNESYYFGKAKISLNITYCQKIIDVDKANRCYIYIANMTNDKSICEKIIESNDEMKCYLNIALNEKNPVFCNLIKKPEYKKICFEKIMNNVDKKSVCDEYNQLDYKEQCYKSVAYKTNDLNICNQISDIEIRENCIKDIAVNLGDFDLCKELELIQLILKNYGKQESYSMRDVCYDEVARKINDLNICTKIGDSKIKHLCKTDIRKVIVKISQEEDIKLYSEAIENSDENICLQINTENKIFECIYEIAISTKNDLLCNKIKSDIQKDMCLRNIAINKKDDLLCKKIDNKLDKEMCLREIAIETSNKEICNDLTDVNRDICIHHFIVFDGDLDSCTNIKNEELSLNCKINIAINSEDDTICFNLENEDKNICFKIFANFHANNLSYCKNIIDKDKVKYCYNTLTNEINENHNLDFCEIEPDIYYDNCLSKLAKEKEDSYLCSLINNTEDRDSCYDYNILRDNEISSCSQIQFFSNSRFSSFGECESFIYYNNALEQKDVSICDKIPFSNLSYKNSCYKTLAYELDNSQLCEKIDYIGDKDECYSSLCIENENLELCDQIKDSLFKDWSKTIIAINTNNENICNTIIQDDFFKQECIKNIDS